MSLGLIGKKIGMTRIYKDRVAIPVTVVEVKGNVVTQVKTVESDGYDSVQVGFGEVKNKKGKVREKSFTKAQLGHFGKAGVEPKRHVREFRVETPEQQVGQELGIEMFADGAWVDVVGVTKGKGFQGVVKRYNFAGSPMTHGSMMHRRTGAIGCRSTPGLVWKNQKMPGRTGRYNRTTQNLQVVASRPEEGVLLIRGCIAGANGGTVIVRPSKKKSAS
jgi:large subunit ribosomal protein L3